MKYQKITKNILSILSWGLIFASAVLLIFGFGEDGLKILKVSEFWIIVNSIWTLAILIFIIENRIN